MQLIADLDRLPESLRGGVASIGKFDGMHRGHLQILQRTRFHAERISVPSLVVSFDPLPGQLLHPQTAPPLLCTMIQKQARIEQCGIDAFVVLRTTPELLGLSPQEFFETVLLRQLDVRMLVEGESFSFGHNRAGNVATLHELCQARNIPLEIVPSVTFSRYSGEIDAMHKKTPENRLNDISSSRIRRSLRDGDVAAAADMLGSPYTLTGMVGRGDQRGRLLGFPTANLEGVQTLVPKAGVYATVVTVHDRRYPAATSIGDNPTFGAGEQRIEAHLLDFEGDLYDKAIAIEFHDRIRDTVCFDNVEALKEQMHRDVDQVRGAMH